MANENYWQRAGIDTIRIWHGGAREIGMAQYQANEVDVVGSVQTGLPQNASSLPGFASSEVSCAIRYLGFVRRDVQDDRLYRAMTYAVDRDQLADSINEGSLLARRILSRTLQTFDLAQLGWN